MSSEPRIRVLPESLANKIAAGEVVERPSSVVKELVENSIDAGAQTVRVEVEEGGRKLIRVADDGCGMTGDEVLLSIERHATSKIDSEIDLYEVKTLGFRGEALPSIAAVSRLEILTRPKDSDEGTRLRVEGGSVVECAPAGCAQGTVVTARDLFFNVPARKKFMRAQSTELANISDFVARIAIAHPEIHFQLTHGGREVIEAPPANDLMDRIANLLGASSLKSMLTLEPVETPDVKVWGMASLPDLSRSDASHIYLYVNDRPVRDKLISHAAQESYRNFLPRGRYPVMVVFVEIDPGEVDVNVHPSKNEVKFRNSRAVYNAVLTAVQNAFDRKRAETRTTLAPPSQRSQESRVMNALSRSVERSESADMSNRDFYERRYESASEPKVAIPSLKPVTKPRPWGYFSELEVLGQLRATYIVCQSLEGLLLIDQHAAHERTAFERLKKEYTTDKIKKQSLLFPETLELGMKEADVMERNVEQFDKLGFEIERFGIRSWRISATPAILGNCDPRDLANDILDNFGSHRGAEAIRDKLDDIFAKMACHGVIRANRNLTREEIAALMTRLDEAEFPLTCPHGRPICVHITYDELEKMFGRK